ncbi:MAG: GLUG motif-containing protein, partial [Gallionella sp.]
TLDASASPPPTAELPSPASGRGVGGEGNGGFIETSGAHVKIDPNAKITTAAPFGKAGTWLIDPVDFTIAATGGDMTGAQLAAALGLNSVIIQSINGAAGTTGDININDVVNWSANKLTLNAQNNIYLNTTLNGSGTASLALEYGQQALAAGNTSDYFVNAPVNLATGQNFSTKLGSDGVVTNYTVITSLGAANSVTATDLQGINDNLAGNYVLGANVDATATATWNAVAGFSTLANAAAFTGKFDGLGHTVNALKIVLDGSNIGLFGYVDGGANIRNTGVTNVSISGNGWDGALVGYLATGTVENSHSSGLIVGSNSGGGLVGATSTAGVIKNSFSTVNLDAFHNIGGLVGYHFGRIVNSYASGSIVNSTYSAGGLVGINNGIIENSYSTTNVSGTGTVGGLVGIASRNALGTVTNSYWDTQTSGQTTSAGGTGLPTAQMQQQASYGGWDFLNTWQIAPNGYPTLKALKPNGTTPVITPVTPVAPVAPVTPVTPITPVAPVTPSKKPSNPPQVDPCAMSTAVCSNVPPPIMYNPNNPWNVDNPPLAGGKVGSPLPNFIGGNINHDDALVIRNILSLPEFSEAFGANGNNFSGFNLDGTSVYKLSKVAPPSRQFSIEFKMVA